TGEPLYQYSFPTGYGEDSSRWVNTGVFLNRLNFMVALANNQVPGTNYDPARFLAPESGNANALTERLAASIGHTNLSPESWKAVRSGLAETAGQPGPRDSAASVVPVSAKSMTDGANKAAPVKSDEAAARRQVAQVVQLLLGTAEFQRR